jgi:hypothetical protein
MQVVTISWHCRHSHWLWQALVYHHLAQQSSDIHQFVEAVQQSTADKTWPVSFARSLKSMNDQCFNNASTSQQHLFYFLLYFPFLFLSS